MIQTCDTPAPKGSPLLPIKDAISKMLAQIDKIKGTDNLPLSETLGRILAVDVISNINVPPADNSAMDGYAMDHQQLNHTSTLKMVGTALAGVPYSNTILAGAMCENNDRSNYS